MKKLVILSIFLSILALSISGCTENNNQLKPDSPTNTTWLMKLAIDNQDYERFNSLFSEGRKGSVSKSEFAQLRDITTPGAEYTNYELLTFENRKMLLVRLTPTIDDDKIEIEDVIIVPEELKELLTKPKLDNNKYDFTYLEELPIDKLEMYNLFLKDGEIYHLRHFTPEQIVLIYMNLVLEHEVDKIYALTYDNGQLPSLDIFTDEYGMYSHHLVQNYLTYRFYDSIKVNEETKTKDMLVVQLEISFGTTRWIKTYSLKKEEEVWKIDLYPFLENVKKDSTKL